MAVRIHHRDGQIRQRIDHGPDIPDPVARIEKEGDFVARDEPRDDLLPLPRFINREDARLDLVDLEPVVAGGMLVVGAPLLPRQPVAKTLEFGGARLGRVVRIVRVQVAAAGRQQGGREQQC